MDQLDLEKRTLEFSRDIIIFCKKYSKDYCIKPTINQLIRSATSIGANYREANAACSLKDFKNKIYICKKEAKETAYWLELLAWFLTKDKILAGLKKECIELEKIFGKITVTLRSKMDENRK